MLHNLSGPTLNLYRSLIKALELNGFHFSLWLVITAMWVIQTRRMKTKKENIHGIYDTWRHPGNSGR